MSKISKLIVPVAGYGTRFLPYTKAAPKEMIPIVDKPVIQIIVEHAVASGIEDIILVTGSNKRAIEDHFDFNFELEYKLKEAGKEAMSEEIRKIARMARFTYVRQKEPKGNGHAVLQAAQLVNKEPFALVWGDEFHIANPPQVKQLIDIYNKYQQPVITLIKSTPEVHADYCSKYGCVDADEVEPGVYKIKDIVEKPDPKDASSNLFSLGGYILTPRVMEILKETPAGKGGEIWLVDALATAVREGAVYGKLIKSKYYDTGSKIGFLKATVDAGLERSDIREEFKKYLKSLALDN
ncbi:MAG TPA: UTP--glucose-1-phosphate uridylyltransferase [bacterium]|jgi:UTP--glucose-1-phosphate uridylyltransferase|nr:UTP--glucose-1-phosphate uridylyltransferase [bacterium]